MTRAVTGRVRRPPAACATPLSGPTGRRAGWPGRNPGSPTGGAFLVAPPDPLGSAFPRQTAATFLEVSAQPLSCRALVVSSADDPYRGAANPGRRRS
ncbi:alpha/beta hydrolase [Streptomyces sp. NPDC059679]|uniref:alpha/beta hydrolase n=1 Tax=Streptomyces sp. NPDC059679 TaxID=3346903 RepID=UPI00368A4548